MTYVRSFLQNASVLENGGVLLCSASLSVYGVRERKQTQPVSSRAAFFMPPVSLLGIAPTLVRTMY
jgi:hypothetical protein